MNASARIAVAGSLNVDHTLTVTRIPRPGETVTGTGAFTCWGGKGANQALAAARAGAAVHLIGCVGADDFGTRYREYLARAGVAVEGVGIAPGAVPTGSAFILVEESGENLIVVHPGANHALTLAHVEAEANRIRQSNVLLLQLECPVEPVRRAAEIARDAGVPVILNPSPWPADLRALRIPCDFLLVNETEAAALLGRPEFVPGELAVSLLEYLDLQALLVTRGSSSTCVCSRADGFFECPPFPVTPVDTVGAGDAFAGAFAVALAEQRPLPEAVRFANAAGALATLKPGAQSAIPTRVEIDSRIRQERSV